MSGSGVPHIVTMTTSIPLFSALNSTFLWGGGLHYWAAFVCGTVRALRIRAIMVTATTGGGYSQ